MLIGAAVGSLGTGCAPILPYSLRVAAPAPSLIPVPSGLSAYEPGLAAHWTQTSQRCAAVECAIAAEIAEREARIQSNKRWLLGIGSAAALVETMYAGIVEDPAREVVVPLSAIAGGALLTAIPALSKDERIDELRARLESIDRYRAAAVDQFNELERGLHELAEWEQERTRSEAEVAQRQREITPLEEELRRRLIRWSETCR